MRVNNRSIPDVTFRRTFFGHLSAATRIGIKVVEEIGIRLGGHPVQMDLDRESEVLALLSRVARVRAYRHLATVRPSCCVVARDNRRFDTLEGAGSLSV